MCSRREQHIAHGFIPPTMKYEVHRTHSQQQQMENGEKNKHFSHNLFVSA